MNFDRDKILHDPFYIYERASPSRKATGFNVFTRCAFRSWASLSDDEKMAFIRPALREEIINRLSRSNVLPPGFDQNNNDPFQIAPFTPQDFKSDLRTVISYFWRERIGQDMKGAWNCRAQLLNARPVVGKFSTLPTNLLGNENNSNKALQVILQKDYTIVRNQFDNIFKKLRNCNTTYKKVERMYLDVAVSHKFYFNGHIPYSIFSSLFGDYSMFEDNEKVCNNTSINDTRTYHIMARDKIYSLLKIDDI